MFRTTNTTGGTFPSVSSKYGAGITLPYRNAHGNAKPDFAGQIWIPNGDMAIGADEMYFRASLANAWNPWKRVASMDSISIANGSTGEYHTVANEHGIILAVGARSDSAEIILYNVNGSGGLALVKIRNTSYLTVTTGTNLITIQNGSGYQMYTSRIKF